MVLETAELEKEIDFQQLTGQLNNHRCNLHMICEVFVLSTHLSVRLSMFRKKPAQLRTKQLNLYLSDRAIMKIYPRVLLRILNMFN